MDMHMEAVAEHMPLTPGDGDGDADGDFDAEQADAEDGDDFAAEAAAANANDDDDVFAAEAAAAARSVTLWPGCGGVCPDGQFCEDTGGSCDCVPYTGQPQTCGAPGDEMCGGTCAFGDSCAYEVGGGGCGCFEPCELSFAPACSEGDCSDPGEVCRNFAATVPGGGTLDFCGCVLEVP